MAYAPAAPDTERLPWLNDDTRPARAGDLRTVILWSIVAALLIAGASFWLGVTTESSRDPYAGNFSGPAASSTVSLPEPYSAEPLVEDVKPTPMLEVKPVAKAPEVTIPKQRSDRPARRRSKQRSVLKRTPIPDDNLREVVEKQALAKPEAVKAPTAKAPTTKAPATQLWPASISQDAYGRVVRIGTFSSRYKAKRAWHRVMRAYPGMRRLKAVVVANPSLRNGRTYYRLQFGTSSQAHSTILCQRMRAIGQSCVVVGLPGGVS